MKYLTHRLCEQATTFDSFRKFFNWIATEQKNPEKQRKYLALSAVACEMKQVCEKLATYNEKKEERREK